MAATAFVKGSSDGNEAALVEQARSEEARIEKLRGKHGGEKIANIRRELNVAMESGCGVFREQDSMQATVETIAQLKGRYADVGLGDTSRVFNTEIVNALELGNMLDVAEVVAVSATARTESRGAHTRTDYPTRNDQDFLKHSVVHFAPDGPRIDYKPVTITRWQPEERKY